MEATAKQAIEREKAGNGKSASKMDQFIALLKVCLWPLVVLVIYFQLHGSITKVFEELPNLVSHSSKVTFGSVSLEIQNSISNSGDPTLADKLKGISEQEFEALMDLKGASSYWGGVSNDRREVWTPTQETIGAWRGLRKRNLVEFSLDDDEFQKALSSLPFHKELKPGATYHSSRALTAAETDILHKQVVRLSSEGDRVIVAAVKLIISKFAEEPNSQGKR
jgi:hypothetical protein